MGKKADRQAAARILWAAERMISDVAGLVPYGHDGKERKKIYEVADKVKVLAGDVYWGKEVSE